MNSNTQMIQKGTISSVEGDPDRNDDKTKARVLPCTAGGVVTRPLTIPWWLRGKMGNLKPGDEVAYVMFEDGTGVILTRMDGKWDGTVPGDITVIKGSVEVTEGDLTITTGGISVPAGDVVATGISHTGHTHAGVHGETSGPH